MRGAGILAYGGPIQPLELPDAEVSDPHQLLIAVHTAGVGNWDDLVRTGGWDVGGTPPLALGVEAAGVVSAIEATVSQFRVGDDVLRTAGKRWGNVDAPAPADEAPAIRCRARSSPDVLPPPH